MLLFTYIRICVVCWICIVNGAERENGVFGPMKLTWLDSNDLFYGGIQIMRIYSNNRLIYASYKNIEEKLKFSRNCISKLRGKCVQLFDNDETRITIWQISWTPFLAIRNGMVWFEEFFWSLLSISKCKRWRFEKRWRHPLSIIKKKAGNHHRRYRPHYCYPATHFV